MNRVAARVLPDPALPAGRPRRRDIINTFDDKPATLSLGTGELSPAVEQRLLGLAEGTPRLASSWPPGEAFGERNPEMLQWVARKLLARAWATPTTNYAVGDVVQFPTPDGQASYAGVGARGRRRRRVRRSTSTIRWPASP